MATTRNRLTTVLDPSTLYLAADRVVCATMRCAGHSAFHTGVGIDNVRLLPITVDDVHYWNAHMGGPLRCECGEREVRAVAGRATVVPALGGDPA